MDRKEKETILENVDWLLTNGYLYNNDGGRLVVCHCVFSSSVLLGNSGLEDLGLDLMLELIKSNYRKSIITREVPPDNLVMLVNYVFLISEVLDIKVDINDLLNELRKCIGTNPQFSLDNLLLNILMMRDQASTEDDWEMILRDLSKVSVASLRRADLVTYLLIILSLGHFKNEKIDKYVRIGIKALNEGYKKGVILENRIYSLIFCDILMNTYLSAQTNHILKTEVLENNGAFRSLISESHFCREYIDLICGNSLYPVEAIEGEDLYYSKVINQTSSRLDMAFLILYEYLKKTV